MRYYSIRLLNPQTKNTVTFSQSKKSFADDPSATTTWTSHDQYGVLNPGALNVELDVNALPLGKFYFGAQIRVWGIGLPALSQSSSLDNYGVEISAGMKPPYNLNKTPHGQIIAGQIYQGYGNWEGVNQHLDFVLKPFPLNPNTPANIPFVWKANTSLLNALTASLQGAFPGIVVTGTIGAYTQGHDKIGWYPDAQAFGAEITHLTKSSTSDGVSIVLNGNVAFLSDDSFSPPPILLNFNDLIGQPTWIGSSVVQFATVMRSDINFASLVTFPSEILPPYALTTPAAAIPNQPATSKTAFHGTFKVIDVHHYGNFRQADATSWRTEYQAIIPGVNSSAESA